MVLPAKSLIIIGGIVTALLIPYSLWSEQMDAYFKGLDVLADRVRGGLCDDIDQRHDQSDGQDKCDMNYELPQSVLLTL